MGLTMYLTTPAYSAAFSAVSLSLNCLKHKLFIINKTWPMLAHSLIALSLSCMSQLTQFVCALQYL